MNNYITYGSTYKPRLEIQYFSTAGVDQGLFKYLSTPVGELVNRWEKSQKEHPSQLQTLTPAYSRVGPLSTLPQHSQSYLQYLAAAAKLYGLYAIARYKQTKRRLRSALNRRWIIPLGPPSFNWTRSLVTPLLAVLLIGLLALLLWPAGDDTNQPRAPYTNPGQKTQVASNTTNSNSAGTSSNNDAVNPGASTSTPDTQTTTAGSPLTTTGQPNALTLNSSPNNTNTSIGSGAPAQPNTSAQPSALPLPYTVTVPAQSLQAGDKQIIGTSPIGVTLN